jgi:hypothetical protein
LYLHLGSGSIQFGSGSTKYNLLPLNAPVVGDIALTGNITASNAYFTNNVRIDGNIILGDGAAGDTIQSLGVFTTNLIPQGSRNIGSTDAYWSNVYATSISGAIAATNGVVSGSSQIISALPTGLVSGSSQVNFTGLAGISSNIVSASSDSANVDIIISNGSISANIYGGVFSGSAQVVGILSSLNAYTASNETTNTNQNNRLTRLEESTASINLTTASLNGHVADINAWTASQNSKDVIISNITSSYNTFTSSLNGHVADINAWTASQNSKDVTISIVTASLNTFTASASSRLGEIESYTASLKTAIDVSGQNVTIQGNLTVAGTTTAVNSTTIQLGDNILELNGNAAANGGLYVKDPTAPNVATGSIIWDSTLDYWKAGVKDAESKVLLAGGDSVVSSSAQVVGILQSLNTFSASQEGKDSTLQTYTASVNTKFSTIEIVTASLNNATASLYSYTASLNNRLNRIEESTASLNEFSASQEGKDSTLQTYTASVDTKFSTLQTYTASVDTKFSTLQTYTASVDSTIARLKESTASLNLYTASNDTTNTNQNNRLSRLEESTASLNTFSASINGHVADINLYTSSINGHIADINAWTGSQKQKDTTLESVTASLNLQTASFNTWTGSVFQPFSTSVDTRLDSLEYTVTILSPGGLEASLLSINSATQSLQAFSQSIHQYTASLNDTIARLKESTASINLTTASLNGHVADINVWSGSAKTSITNLETKATTLQTYTASVNGHITDINAYTSSNDTTNTNQNNRLNRIEESTSSLNSYTASLKTAIGLSGTDVTINGNLSVLGTTTQINSTQVNIGENILELNYGGSAATAGIYVKDATAASTVSGSLLWDATNDIWIAGKKDSEAKVLTDGMGVISGSGQLGSYETTGRGIVSGSSQVNFTGLSGISNNIISASTDSNNIDFTITGGSITADLKGGVVSGSSQVSYLGLSNIPAGIVSGSSQINFTQLSGISNGIVSGSSQIIPLLPIGTVSGSSQVIGILSSLNSFTSSLDATYATEAEVAAGYEAKGRGIVSGSSQVNFTQLSGISNGIVSSSSQITPLLPTGVVSGSSQVSYIGLSNIPSGIVSGAAQVTPLLPTGVVSGSSQVYSGVSGDITIASNGVATIGANAVVLGTDTSGNYVATIAGTTNQITVAGSGTETAAITLSTPQDIHTSATPQFASLGIGTAASGVSGEIRATGDIVAYYSSDERLKENINPIQNALEKVESISGNTYDWKEGFETIHSHKGHDLGVIAQEVQSVLPEVVTERETGYLAVDYVKLVPVLIEAIKELSARVKELESK